MKIKRRKKLYRRKELDIKRLRKKAKPKMKIKRLSKKPEKRYTKGGHFIIENKPWRERFVPCRECRHWCRATKMYIAEDGTEGWICPKVEKPRLHNAYVICRHYDDEWVTTKRGIVRRVIDRRPKPELKVKRRRKKKC